MIRFVHASDFHIGKRFVSLGKKGNEQRKQIKKTFSKVVDLCIQKEVHAFVLTGDLFDTDVASEIDLQFILSELSRLSKADIKTFLIAGNHDYFSDVSVYRDAGFYSDENIILFTESRDRYVWDEFDVTFLGASCYAKKSTKSPFSYVSSKSTTKHSVYLIHGSYAIPEKHLPDSFPFTSEEIAGSGADYVACGDWHSYLDVSAGDVKAFYSGAAEALGFGQDGSGFVNVVEITDSGAHVEKIKVGKRDFQQLEMDVTGNDSVIATFGAELLRLAGPDVMLDARLTGTVSADSLISVAKLEEEYADHFYLLKIHDETHVAIEDINLDMFPEELVVGQFVRNMMEKIESAESEEEKVVLEKALQVGVQKLGGV